MMDIVEILEETLNVIKRQRAEVKRLSAEVKRLAADKESLKGRLYKVRAETVQEFENRLKEKIELDSDLNLDSYDIIVLENHMESIAKEMTEVSE